MNKWTPNIFCWVRTVLKLFKGRMLAGGFGCWEGAANAVDQYNLIFRGQMTQQGGKMVVGSSLGGVGVGGKTRSLVKLRNNMLTTYLLLVGFAFSIRTRTSYKYFYYRLY